MSGILRPDPFHFQQLQHYTRWTKDEARDEDNEDESGEMCLSRVRVELTKDHRLQRRRLNSLNGALAHFGHKAAESFSNMSF